MANSSKNKQQKLTKTVKSSKITTKSTSSEATPVKSKSVIATMHKYKQALITILQATGIFLGGQIMGAFVVTIIGMSAGADEAAIRSAINDNHLVRFLLILAIEVVTVWLVWLFLRRRAQTFKEIGLTKRPTLSHVKTAAIGYVLYFVLFLIIITIVGLLGLIDTTQEQQIGFNNVSGVGTLLAFMSLVILPPIAEEILFRGFLFKRLLESVHLYVATAVTSVLFAVVHLEFGTGLGLNWAAALDTMVLSVVLCYVTFKSKSLWPAIFIHAVKNAVAFTVLFLV